MIKLLKLLLTLGIILLSVSHGHAGPALDAVMADIPLSSSPPPRNADNTPCTPGILYVPWTPYYHSRILPGFYIENRFAGTTNSALPIFAVPGRPPRPVQQAVPLDDNACPPWILRPILPSRAPGYYPYGRSPYPDFMFLMPE